MNRLSPFVDQVERDLHGAAKLGSRIKAIYVGPEGENGILSENLKCPHQDIDIVPELRIHGVPVKVHKSIRSGRFLYVLKEAS